jgi:hypothetical protein
MLVVIGQLGVHSLTGLRRRASGGRGTAESSHSLAHTYLMSKDARPGPRVVSSENTTATVRCKNGGLETSRGCICGKGTTGLACEGLDASALLARPENAGIKVQPPQQQQHLFESHNSSCCYCIQVCGPDCFPVFTWYWTEFFTFRPLTERHGDRYLRSVLAGMVAWRDGAELREQVQGGQGGDKGGLPPPDDILDDPDLLDMATSLGPWTQSDKVMMRALGRFRRELRSGLIRAVPPPEPARSEGIRIVFGIMLHDDLPRFEALWRVLFHEDHYFALHIDRVPSDPTLRSEVRKVIEATPCCRQGSIWDRVVMVEEENSVDSLWGDITLVYAEYLLYLRVLQQAGWDWDYFINVSGADIPVRTHDEMARFLGERAPHSFLYHHENKDEFRQTYMVVPQRVKDVVFVFSALQKDMQPGRYRERIGITRLWGCSQWHVLHRRMLTQLATLPAIGGLLFSLKFTAIPDGKRSRLWPLASSFVGHRLRSSRSATPSPPPHPKPPTECFFATAAVWIHQQDQGRYPLQGWDLRYWNEVRQDGMMMTMMLVMMIVTMVMVMMTMMAWPGLQP